MCEHLLPDKLTFSGACGTGRLHIPANRVLPSQGCAFILSPLLSNGVWGGSPMVTHRLWPWIRGRQKTGEHSPADKLTFSFACRAGRFRVPINRVPSYQSGIRKR